MPKRNADETNVACATAAKNMKKNEGGEPGVVEHDQGSLVVPYAELRLARPLSGELPEVIQLQNPNDPTEHTIGSHKTKNVTSMRCSTIQNLMSSEHAALSISRDGVHHIRDKNTKNGTYVNGALISTDEESFALRNGDVISFGGPPLVSIDGKEVENPLQYAYYRLPSVTVWSEATRGIDRPPALPDWLEEEVKCGICQEHMSDPHSINGCGHVFCKACISRWIDTQGLQKKCPTCGEELPGLGLSALISPDPLVRGMVDRVESNFTSLEQVRERAEHVKDIEKRPSVLRIQAARDFYDARPRSELDEMLRRDFQRAREIRQQRESLHQETRPGRANVAASANAATPPSGNGSVIGSQNNGQTQRSETDARVSWRGSGVTQTRDVRCAACDLRIPAKCFRLVRTCHDDTKHFHTARACVRRHAHELETPDVSAEILNDAGITDQQKRLTARLFRRLA